MLCTLLANSLVVHTDETSWSLKSVWAFLSEQARLVLFGVNKDAETLKKILDPASFAGIVISDDAAVYANFTESQKCWAHLLRKAIKLTLQDPNNAEYRGFTDRLLEIYREACRFQRDKQLSDEDGRRKVLVLEAEIVELCEECGSRTCRQRKGSRTTIACWSMSSMRLMLREELFTFVTAKPVEQVDGTTKPVDGTNNEAERTLRGAAQARKTGRTNKTSVGTRRQTILVSVLESLRLYLTTFTLGSVLEELQRWWATGQSCFEKLVEKLKLTPPEHPVADQLLPGPSG